MKLITFAALFVVLSAGFAFSDERREVPALFVFGDSLLDVGNNRYLPSAPNVSFLPYGIDFPHSRPTGRFSNGYNSMDYIAMALGFKRSPPPYLSFNNTNHLVLRGLRGANFASGGSGILDDTGSGVIPVTKQIEDFAVLKRNISAKLGPVNTNGLLSKSIFIISAGANDISRSQNFTPSEFLMLTTAKYQVHLRNLYDLGARKFAVIGIPLVGCTPAARRLFPNCSAGLNGLAQGLNSGINQTVLNLNKTLAGFKYSFCSAYNLVSTVVANPHAYGFTNVTTQCCGSDEKDLTCRPTSHYCSDRREFVFWDGVHPTEDMARIAGYTFYNGTHEFASPMNLRELAQEE